MKKRILSILLLCCMVLTLLPTAAFAADTGKAIQLGTDALSKNVNTASAPTVYFGQDHENNPAAWRVIGYNGNGVASAQGDMTLLAAGNMSSVLQFADFGTNNRYASSYLKTAIDALAEKLTTEENTAVKKRTLTSGSYNGENTDCVAGEQVDNAVFWPLSTAEAFAVNQDLRIVDPEHPSWASSYWWLRSPGYSDHDAATVNGDGSVVYSGNAISSWWCVRPAFNLNSSSVLFTSAAVGGKPDGGLTPISKYTGNEWKLTLKDSNRNFAVTETTVSGDPGDTVTLHYTGATAGINEYISVILADNSGAQYYGRVAQPTAENGTVEIKIPSGLALGSYTLKVFSEQCNDDKKTDYASDFVDIDLTVGYQEQFTLTPGGVYYFDLSGVSIPGTANGSLPDKTMHYVPFTYAGTVDAYKLTSEMATTEEYAQQNEYAHSLFVADYAVTHAVSWDDLNATGLIFGKGYATGSVDYTLRAPSGGSGGTGSGALERGTPQSNEWDRILDKDDGYIQNIVGLYSWGQDTPSASASQRVGRGYYPLRGWSSAPASYQTADAGFRPVLEVLGLDKLGYDGLKAVTLDLGGGTLGGSSEDIQIIVKNSSVFTAPASNGLTRPDGDTGSYFKWLGSDGELYEPGDSVSADVTRLTAQFVLIEQFRLAPGGTYYFDLSAMSIPGTVNSNLPDQTMHYVPFTYVGIVDAYKLTSETATTEEYAEKNKYPHSLFVADYAVTGAVNWNVLNNASLIFGKDYAAGGVDYMLRAPSVGSGYTGQDELQRRTPQSNEWDRILDKNDGYIKNWSEGYSWGQDTSSASSSHRGIRWNGSSHKWASADTKFSLPALRFHPVLEVLSPGTLGPDGLKTVTLDLGGGKLGGSSQDIQIIVKSGEIFTAPASDGLTLPDGDTGSYFKWLGSDGNLYAPGDSVPANVNKLTAQFAPSSHSVTITTDTLPDGKVGEAYSQTLIATGTTPITWSIIGALPDGLSLNKDTGKISGTPTADCTAKFTVKATNSAGSDTKELSITIAKAAPAEYTVTVKTDGNGTASASHAKAVVDTEITLTATPDKGYHFKEWQVESPAGLVITNNKFTMPDSNVEVKAIFEKDAPPAPTDPAKPSISVIGTYTYNGSEHIATVNGYDPATMDITGNTGADAGDYTVSVTSKTGKWADGSTDAVTAAWSIGKATQEAPNGLIGVAPTTEGGSDGKITGVDATMEYRAKSETIYTACTGIEIENLPAGNYFVRYAEDHNHFASSDTVVTVGDGAQLEDFTITFDGNGGSGNVDSVTVKAGTNYILPACGFTAPTDQKFKAWEIGGTEYKVGDSYTVDRNTEIKALWENSVITPTTYTVTVSNDGNGTGTASPSTAAAGTTITLTATPNKGYHFKEWQVMSGGVTIKDNKFTMPNDNVEVKAVFEEDVPAPTEFTITMKTDGNGTASASHAKAIVGTEITLTATPKTGYHFKEWQVISGSVTIKDNKFTMPNDNVEVKAIFEKDAPPAPTEFIVTFDGNGGTPSVSSMTTTNQKLTSLPSASRSGSYSFDGWYTEKSGGTKITTDTVFSADTTVYAHWTYTGGGGGGYNPPVTYYTLLFETGGGSDISSVRETYNAYIDLTKYVPTWRGHTFIGWYTERSLMNKVSGIYLTKDMTVYAGWRVDENPGTGVNPFTDVSEKDWFNGDVMFVYENGLMLGTSKTMFSPHGTATRGMMATILWRMEGSPATKGKNSFTDVEAGKWYADAITWTAENGIFAGYGKEKFGPDDPITREQLATIFYRYADYKGYDLTVKGNLDKFKDADKITDYAKMAMQWAVGSGLVKGKSGNLLDPQGTATRAEIAAMLHRFIEKYELV